MSLAKIPWYALSAAVIAAALALAIGANALIGPYFERSFLDEASPLVGASGDGQPGGRAAPTAPATGTAAPGAQPALTPAAAIGSPSPTAATTTTSAAPPTAARPAPAVISQGTWRDGAPGHNGSGIVKIIRTESGGLVLRVEEFAVTNGPDLFVVLSPDAQGYGEGSLTLGGLKATDGSFNYEIPDGTDLSQYKSAVVWCRSAKVTFAYATLEPAA